MTAQNWETLSTEKQRTLLEEMNASALAQQYGRSESFFGQAKAFFADLPKQTGTPKPVRHDPPKDLIVSARRDLSFYEANFELFDNSIDEWRRRGTKKDLHISVYYDLELLTGKYTDDAGGMEEADVFRVFIPGETTNRDYQQNVIGSFGMGAKKGIFRLADGAKVVSCPSGNVSFTSTTLSVWLMGLKMLRQHALTPVLSNSTNAVFQGFLTECGCLILPAPDIFPLKISNLVILTK